MRICTIKGLSMPISIAQSLPSNIAYAHMISSVSDSQQVNTSLVKSFSFILEQVLCSGGRKAVEDIWRSDLSCIVCNRWR